MPRPWSGSFSACLAEMAPQRVVDEEQRRGNGCRSEGGWQDNGSQRFRQLSLKQQAQKFKLCLLPSPSWTLCNSYAQTSRGSSRS